MGKSAARHFGLLSGLAGLFLAAAAGAADPVISAKLDPAEIPLGQSARLVLTATGTDLPPLRPPTIPGLEFTRVAESHSVQSVNGVMSSSLTVTYQITAHQVGTYVISSLAPGMQALSLKVDADEPPGSGTTPGGGAGAPPSGTSSSAKPPADARLSADGAAFVRLIAPRRELYVGQSLAVDIEVGTRDGVVASLNGLPALNGAAFTLDKLAAQPERRTQEIIDGRSFTVFGWRGVLAAVKTGTLTLALETPMTIRVPIQRPAPFPDSLLNDVFNDPAFQGFFGASTQRDITVSSPEVSFTVLELPTEGRPKDFSGAVGEFKVTSELSDVKVAAGDPVTLRLKVSGEGNFDRVKSSMFQELDGWKTYPTTSKFTPAADTRYRGDKTFEQPLVATTPGKQTLPALSFSYFDPNARRYETAHTESLTIEVTPAAATAASPTPGAPAAAAPLAPAIGKGTAALRADHAPGGNVGNSLLPFYYQPQFMAMPALLLLAVSGVWLWLRHLERRVEGGRVSGLRPIAPGRIVAEMTRASAAGDEQDFFHAARAGLRNVLAARWQLAPESVTVAEIDARLGSDSEVRRLFVLADEAMYSERRFTRSELEHWKRVVLRHMETESELEATA
jgi:hypothetical protein